MRQDFLDVVIIKYYQIHVIESTLVDGHWYSEPNYSFIINNETGKEWDPKSLHKNYMENKGKKF